MRQVCFSIACIILCTLCGPYVAYAQKPSSSAKTATTTSMATPTKSATAAIQHPMEPTAERRAYHEKMHSMTHEQRVAHRAERQAEFEKYVDSIVLSHNFEFNPQTAQRMPAGNMVFLSNINYTVTLWRGTLDVCLPYWVGYTPPYRYVLLNTVTPNLRTILTKQTDEGWQVSFKANLYAAEDYNFVFDINSKYGGATLTISSLWYNPVQYSGTITRVY